MHERESARNPAVPAAGRSKRPIECRQTFELGGPQERRDIDEIADWEPQFHAARGRKSIRR
jgi:hypothetical protein